MRMPAAALAVTVLLTGACSGGEDPIEPRRWALESLGFDVEVAPTHAIAGDTVDVVVTVTNERTSPITLQGAEACVVSTLRVVHWSQGLVSFVGSGEQPCPGDARLWVPGSGSAELRVPLVVWQVPDSTTSPFIDGPPRPSAYRVEVRSELLGQVAEGSLTVLASGLHVGSAPICGAPPSGSDPVGIVLRPDVIGDAVLRVRFEIHNRGFDGLSVERCAGTVVTAIDRRTPDGWLLGQRVQWCTQGPGTGFERIPIGGCLRSVTTEWDYEPGEYRLRIWTRSDTLTTDSMVFPP